MVSFNNLIPLFRTIAFGSVGLFSLIVLGISAHLVSLRGPAPDYVNFALAVAILTLIFLPLLFILPIKRRGSWPSYLAVELGVLWFLWILWLASAAHTASMTPGLNYCSGGICSELRAMLAFSFLNWLILMFYAVLVFVFAVIAHSRGERGVWRSTVQEHDWDHKSGVLGA